jgi:hypothetical protein
MGGDFFKNPKGLNLLFCKPGTKICFLFFSLFFLKFPLQSRSCYGNGFFGLKYRNWCFGIQGFFKGCGILKQDKNQVSNQLGMVLSCFEILHSLFLDLIFVNAFISVGSGSFQLADYNLMEKGSIYKKQCK